MVFAYQFLQVPSFLVPLSFVTSFLVKKSFIEKGLESNPIFYPDLLAIQGLYGVAHRQGMKYKTGLLSSGFVISFFARGFSRDLLFLASVIGFIFAPSAQAAEPSSTSTDMIAMRHEMLAMRHEMQVMRHEMLATRHEMLGEIQRLKAQLRHKNGGEKHTLVTVARRTRHVDHSIEKMMVASEAEPKPTFQEVSLPFNGPRSPAQSRLSDLPGSPVQSWQGFKAASENEEVVDIGHMKIGFPHGGAPTISSDDHAYAFSAGILAQNDIGGFMSVSSPPGEGKGKFPALTENARRLWLAFRWRYKNWVMNVTPGFGAVSETGQIRLVAGNLDYTGLRHTILTIGFFQPRMEEESAEGSGQFEFLERPTVVDLVRNLAGGIGRFSIGGLHYEKNWLVGAYLTGKRFGQGETVSDTTAVNSQTGAVFRVAGRPYSNKDMDVFLGAGGTTAFKVDENNKDRKIALMGDMELPLGETNLLTSGELTNVSQIWAVGPQAALRWKKFLLKGEYYRIGVQRKNETGIVSLPSLGFNGWYIAANYTLLGYGRAYNPQRGAFTTPGVEYDFDPRVHHWGALEVSARWSVLDLNDVVNQGGEGVDGNKQTVWKAGFNWYPTRQLKIMLDYAHFFVTPSKGVAGNVNLYGRSGNAVASRFQVSF